MSLMAGNKVERNLALSGEKLILWIKYYATVHIVRVGEKRLI